MRRRTALTATALLLIAGCGDNSGGLPTTTAEGPTTTTTTLAATTTTAASTTTAPPATTTTVAMTTTTGGVRDVLLSDEGIQAGAVWVYFGYDDDDAVAVITAELGPPDHDSGWIDSFGTYGVCPAPEVRGVEWGGLILLFTTAETDFWIEGVEHFFAFTYVDAPPAIETTLGLTVGDTITDLEALYGGSDLVIAESPFDPSAAIWSYDAASWTGLFGFATSQNPDGLIQSINGGRGCGE